MPDIKIIADEGFENGVFGGIRLLTYFPLLKTTGAKCRFIQGNWHFINPETNQPYNDTCFLSPAELNKFTEIVGE